MLGQVLRCIKIAQEKKTKDVANLMGCSCTYITEVENGHKTPSYEMLKKFSKCFDVPASKIVEWHELAEKNNLSYQEILLLCVQYEVEVKNITHNYTVEN